MKQFNLPTISPVLRITLGLLSLMISLLLLGDLFGIIPNQKQSEMDARKIITESLAIQVSSEIAENQIEQAAELLNIVVKRNQNIQSVGLKGNSKKMIMQSDGHEQYWLTREDDYSTADHIQVPIYSNQDRWGTLEVSFTPLGSVWSTIFTGRSFAAMVLFIFIFGFIIYWVFLKRVLSELDPSSVVPDRVRSALDVLSEGLVILDASERIILMNDSLKSKLSLSESELVGKRLSSLPWEMENDALAFGKQALPWNVLFETNEIPILKHLKLKTDTQGTLTFDVNVSPIKAPNQKIKGAIVTISDITELEKKNNELGHMLKRLEKNRKEINRQNLELFELATRDPLTHALNRRSLIEGFNELLAEAYNQADVLSCIMVDIDRFKSVNDNYGHAVGDKVIQIVVNILQNTVRPNDLIGRYGGEEFIIVLPGTDESKAAEIANNIRFIISEIEHNEFPENLTITASFGIASTSDSIWESNKIIDHADQALYIAKQSGRNRVVRYSQKDADHSKVETSSGTALTKKKSHTRKNQSISSSVSKKRELTVKSEEMPTGTFEMMGELSRTVILDRLTQAIKLAQRDRTNLAVLTIFIDTIQITNNTLGHASAEKLRKVAFERLTETFRLSDSVMPEVDTSKSISLSRSSDSGFTAILSGIEEVQNTTWAIFRMMNELAVPVEIDGNEIVMTTNIGISIYETDGENPEQLLSNSKMALQKAREEGRGIFLFYNQKMNTLSKLSLKIESQLHQAVEREELYLNFQPIINMQTERVEKLEALLRWKHPELGLVSTDTFIDIAEHAGIIKTIGLWVIQKACNQLKDWHRNGHPHLMVSINLSAVQFYQPHLADEIIDIVKKEGLSPRSIAFELTETVLLKKLDHISETIFKLHSAGFIIALDDFGTGYSSLDHLRNFPIDWIKIDRSFMTNFPDDVNAVSIISGLISLAHNLGMHVIAEGVEHESQLLMLHDLKCDEIQGYLISRPLAAEDVTKYLESTNSRRLIRKVNMVKSGYKDEQNNTSLTEILNSPPV